MRYLRLFIVFLLAILGALQTHAATEARAIIDIQNITACYDSSADQTEIPSFTDPACHKESIRQLNPHQTSLWMKTSITIDKKLLNNPMPLGFIISGKAASRVYVNGNFVGENGIPGHNQDTEQSGKMDAVLPLAKRFLNAGQNELVILMSGHHSLIELSNPIHTLRVRPYVEPSDTILRYYLPSFIPLGVLLLGAGFFGVVAYRQAADEQISLQVYLLPLVALFASIQLIAEISRGIIAYNYPAHDIRLLMILLAAFGGGYSLMLHIIARFIKIRRHLAAFISFIAIGLLVAFAPGFDGKSQVALLTPALAGAIIAYWAYRRGDAKAIAYSVALGLFVGAILLTQSQFLDVFYYYFVASLILFLFGQQIIWLQKLQAQHIQEQARANQLQKALDAAKESSNPTTIKVSHAGKIHMIASGDIVCCKGARDYVELCLSNGDALLHSSSLNELEKTLPTTFLKVHRSYLVNMSFIQHLNRQTNGSGELTLSTGQKVPVSRRIMPTVKKALSV